MLQLSDNISADDENITNKFPRYKDGDTLIRFLGHHSYCLHANILRQNSPVFAHWLGEERGASLSSRAIRSGVKVRYCLNYESTHHTIGDFNQQPVNEMGCASNEPGTMSLMGCQASERVIAQYDNLFKAFYNLPLHIDTTSLETILKDACILLEFAEEYQAISSLSSHLEAAFLGCGKTLYRSIAKDPIQWADLGSRIQSRSIVKECMIHIVGNWNMYQSLELEHLGQDIRIACERKAQKLIDVKRATEIRMLGHYSPVVCKKQTDDIGKVNYANGIMPWIALSIFRHWLGQQIAQGRNWVANDGGFELYSKIFKGEEAYIDKYTLEGFHQYCPMTDKGKGTLRKHLNAYKNEMKVFVKPLMKNNTQCDLAGGESFTYFVFAKINDEDVDRAFGIEEDRQPGSLSEEQIMTGPIDPELDA